MSNPLEQANLMDAVIAACQAALVRHDEPELADLLGCFTGCKNPPVVATLEPEAAIALATEAPTAAKRSVHWSPEQRAAAAERARSRASGLKGRVKGDRKAAWTPEKRKAQSEIVRQRMAALQQAPDTPKAQVSQEPDSWYEPPETNFKQPWPKQRKPQANGELKAKLPAYCPSIEQYLGVVHDLLDRLQPSAICTKRGLPTMHIGPIVRSALVHAGEIESRVEQEAKDRYWARLKEALNASSRGGKDAGRTKGA